MIIKKGVDFTTLSEARIPELIAMLRRFPQCAHPVVCGDRGLNDLRIFAPISGSDKDDSRWEYYRLDADDSELPWLAT